MRLDNDSKIDVVFINLKVANDALLTGKLKKLNSASGISKQTGKNQQTKPLIQQSSPAGNGKEIKPFETQDGTMKQD